MTHLRNINPRLREDNLKLASECALLHTLHGRLAVLVIRRLVLMLGGLLQQGDGAGVVHVLLPTRPPMEKAGVAQNSEQGIS